MKSQSEVVDLISAWVGTYKAICHLRYCTQGEIPEIDALLRDLSGRVLPAMGLTITIRDEELEGAKKLLKAKGYSNRAAAKKLGVGFVHLNRVLNGHRASKRLLARISSLPRNAEARQ